MSPGGGTRIPHPSILLPGKDHFTSTKENRNECPIQCGVAASRAYGESSAAALLGAGAPPLTASPVCGGTEPGSPATDGGCRDLQEYYVGAQVLAKIKHQHFSPREKKFILKKN